MAIALRFPAALRDNGTIVVFPSSSSWIPLSSVSVVVGGRELEVRWWRRLLVLSSVRALVGNETALVPGFFVVEDLVAVKRISVF